MTKGNHNDIEPKETTYGLKNSRNSISWKAKGKTLKKIGKHFCQESTLHGIKYIGEDGRPLYERIAWVFILIVFLIFGAFVMVPIYNKWQVVPTVTSVDTTNYPIWNIYFPAVTICSNNKIVMKQLENEFHTEPWKNLTAHDLNFREDLIKALSATLSFEGRRADTEDENQTLRVQQILDVYKDKMPSLIQKATPSCSNLILYCKWQGKVVECGDLFGVRNTDNGYCCSFNTLKMSEQFVKTEQWDNSSTLTEEYEDYDLDAVLAGCPIPTYYADGYCDDYNNIPECSFDGGDCCDENSNKHYCTFCDCVNNYNYTGCPYSNWISDGYCDDVVNIASCNFDGGDCCNANSSFSYCEKCECITSGDSNCTYPYLIENGQCNDITNIPECAFDGGDCCNSSASKEYCIDCKCFESSSIKSISTSNEKSTVPTNGPSKLRKTNAANSRLGLTLLLFPDLNSYHSSAENNFVGFKVLVHSPYDFAEVAGKGFTIGAGTEAFIAVGAQYTTSSEEVQAMPLEKRKCLSHSENLKDHPEIILEAFQNYSRKACILECQARDIFKSCGCLPYYLVEFSLIWKVNAACDLDGLKCLASTADSKRALQPDDLVEEGFISDAPACNCPIDCEETLYFQEMSESEIKEKPKIFKSVKKNALSGLGRLYEELKNASQYPARQKKLQKKIDEIENASSIVHIYFKELGIKKYSRDQVYTSMDAIAAFGGIIGLCSGFSFVSAVEIVYWLAYKVFCLKGAEKKKKNKITSSKNTESSEEQ